MRLVHVFAGAVLLSALAIAAVAGAIVLSGADAGGLEFHVEFPAPPVLTPGDRVLFGDTVVGRVRVVEGPAVSAAVEPRYAEFVREGSRFWVQTNLGTAMLCFDMPPEAGPAVQPGARLRGLADRPPPAPGLLPPARPRRLTERPVWLCDVRAVVTLREGEETVRDQARQAAGAIIRSEEGTLTILAPSWLFEHDGEAAATRARIEVMGGENLTARLVQIDGPVCLLIAQGSNWQGATATLYTNPLPQGQTLVLADFAANAWTAQLGADGLEFRGVIGAAQIALVDGLKIAGFALPAVGSPAGARWVPIRLPAAD